MERFISSSKKKQAEQKTLGLSIVFQTLSGSQDWHMQF